MPLIALNCIVVFSATKVDKMVPAPLPCRHPHSHAQPSQRPHPDGQRAPVSFYTYECSMGRVELLQAACSESEGDNNH